MIRHHLFAAVVLAALSVPAQDPWPVCCLGPDGQPAEGVEVYVAAWEKGPAGGRYVVHGPFATDASGTAETVVATTFDGGRFDRWIYARVPGRCVGAARHGDRFATPAQDRGDRTLVRLMPSRTVRGRVALPDGIDPTTVQVRVLSMSMDAESHNAVPRYADLPGLERALPERFEVNLDAEGRFELADVPAETFLVLESVGPGVAQGQWSTVQTRDRRTPDELAWSVALESSFDGRIVGPSGRAVAGATVAVRRQRGYHLTRLAARTDAKGRFEIDGLPTGAYDLTVEAPDGLVLRPLCLSVGGAASKNVELQLVAAVELSGFVVDQDGKPVEHASVVAHTAKTAGLRMDAATTDLRGRFTLRVAPGSVCVRLAGVPGGDPGDVAPVELDVAAGGDEPPAPLRFRVDVRGR